MASILKSKAMKNVATGNTSAYYSYVEEKNGTNPVIQQIEKELNDYMGFVKKKHQGLLKPGEHAPCKVSDALFDIWNKFEPRVPRRYFYQKLMQIGEFLVKNKEFSTASWQCYDRYLNGFTAVNLDKIQTQEDLKRSFFSDGINNENSDVTLRALMGHCICMFHVIVSQDMRLQNSNSIQQIAEILRVLRLIMQILLEVDHFCWLIYNATIYMYTIGRFMMQYGQSKIMLEYLLFCSLSMESSIPLLGVKYLSWRSTLYALTCQCYYDVKYNDDGEKFFEGEMFARRALSKINELHELELASINGEKGAQALEFREATIKIGALLFKRLVFESRRKTKGLLRPKVRINYKDLSNQSWPRTGVEKILNEMFDCSSAQFLAIEEALRDSNRRIAMPTPAANENEFELLDVALELFFAAEYLANGGGGKNPVSNDQLSDFKSLVYSNQSIMQMAIDAENFIQMKNFLKIVKLAFSYEAWDLFRRISNKIVFFLESAPELAQIFRSDLQIIYLLQATDKYLIYLRKLKHIRNEAVKATLAATNAKEHGKSPAREEKNAKEKLTDQSKSKSSKSTVGENKDNEDAVDSMPSPTQSEGLKEEELLSNIAFKLLQIMDLNIPPDKTDIDVIVDITLLLWKKCKEVFQKYQTGSNDNYKWVTKLENFSKWLFVLNVAHSSMCYFNLSIIDPAAFAHCSIRLGLVYEAVANVLTRRTAKESISQVENEDAYSMSRTANTKFTLFEMNDNTNDRFGISNDIRGNLLKSKNILSKALDSIAHARANVSRSDKTFMCDKDYSQENVTLSYDISTKTSTNQKKIDRLKSLKEKSFKIQTNIQTDSVTNLIADLHVELIFLYHKISVRLIDPKDNKIFQNDKEKNYEKDFITLMSDCKKNKVSQSLLLLAKALYLSSQNFQSEEKVLVQKAYNKLLKVQEEDRMLYDKHVMIDAKIPVKSKIPPAPVICLRTHTKIVVQPRCFESIDGAKTCWYRIFTSPESSINAKARISDYNFPGCGEQLPSNNAEKVTISGLSPNEKYIFAVCAYDKNGTLIGDSIGDSTDPILASNTLSILMNWAYLCQVCYQIEEFDLALTAFDTLWNHFILKPVKEERETFISQNKVDYEITFHQLNYDVVEKTSPILLRKFLECFFIVTDIQIKRKKIYCDLLYDGKIQYPNQIDRVQECEKLLVAIDLAGWLNDSQIILQAIVQCYGLLAPLIYFNLAYDPIVQVLSHCLLVLDEMPPGSFQKKAKNVFESIQHMIACTTFYLTDILKRSNKRTLSNYFNLIGRKLLGIEEANAQTNQAEEQDDSADKKYPKKKLADEPKPSTKINELKALELFQAKSNAPAKTTYFNMLTGNEDVSQIYSYISQNPVKNSYRELIKFRKRTNYFELLTNLLQKALTEELIQEVNEWCTDTLEWMRKRNTTILGVQTNVTRKQDGVIAVTGNAGKPLASELAFEVKEGQNTRNSINKKNKKRKIKKYKLLIPLELEMAEKIRLEEAQKKAIDIIYDLFPERYESWNRRKKLRKLFMEESAFKSQFYVVWAMANFSTLINRIQSSSPQNLAGFVQRLNSSSYLDPQFFLFDKSNAFLMNLEETNLNEKYEDKIEANSILLKNKKNAHDHANSRSPNKSVANSQKNSEAASESEKIHELKDTCDIFSELISAVEDTTEKENNILFHFDGQKYHEKITTPISLGEFTESACNVFNKFKLAVVISHRGKQWTQLQNTCKLIFNCINSLLALLPAVSFSGKRVFKLKDLWKVCLECIYLAAENLLDMMFHASPIEKNTMKENQHDRINKWYDSPNVGKFGANLKFDVPLDDSTSIDLRFVKDFIFRSIQCLCSFEKWEKLTSVGLKFNAMTGYYYAEQLSPILIHAQKRLIKQTSRNSFSNIQPHFEKLKAELGRYPTIEDLYFFNLKVEIDPENLKKIELGVKIDPRVHDIYQNDNKSKELISVPLDTNQSMKCLRESLENSLYICRALMHARRLLSLYLLAHTNQTDFFEITVNNEENQHTKSKSDFYLKETSNVESVHFGTESVAKSSKSRIEQKTNDMFHSNPINFANKTFENSSDVFIKEINISLPTVIESYVKSIELLSSQHEKDFTVQAMHELGNIYHYSKNITLAYKYWNEALDHLIGIKDSLLNWRKEFKDSATTEINTGKILQKCGVWGCLLGGILTSKMAHYYLANDLELKTECCLFSATFFKCIFRASVPYSKYDIDYVKSDSDFFSSDYLIPGLLFNSDMHRFDIRYIIASLNYICLELLNAGHYLYIMPSLALYEYFSKMLSRDLTHTVFARLIKVEALTKLNLFSESISLLNSLAKGERLPHLIDDKSKVLAGNKYIDISWSNSKPVFDLQNLKCLEGILSLKLPLNIIKLYGPHLTCRFCVVQCKLFIQISSCMPCLPNFEDFESSQLNTFLNTFGVSSVDSFAAAKMANSNPYGHLKKNNYEDNPDTVKVFTKSSKPLTLEFIKGCLLGSAKSTVMKCLRIFDEDFPKIDRYCVSNNWQREFKYECNIMLAKIADQSQLGYLSLQNIVEAMRELAEYEEEEDDDDENETKSSSRNTKEKSTKSQRSLKQSKLIKKGPYQVFDLMSRSHLNTRLWLNARVLFVQYMFNQLGDAGKAKGNDENIIRDFGDLKYYCDRCLDETEKFYDVESRAFFQFIDVCLELTRGAGLQSCVNKIDKCLMNFIACTQLSLEGLINFTKAAIFKNDLKYTTELLDVPESVNNPSNQKQNVSPLNSTLSLTIDNLVYIQKLILDDLKLNGGEAIECYVDEKLSYFNNIAGEIKNIFNPLFHYLIHLKLRIGSCLMLKSSFLNNSTNKGLTLSEQKFGQKGWQHAFNVIGMAIELNKVICERSLTLEIELNYKYAHCIRELFMKEQVGSLSDVVDAYAYTINLTHNSTHDLNIIKNCYLELSIAFISTFDAGIVNEQGTTFIQALSGNPPQTPSVGSSTPSVPSSAKPSSTRPLKKITPQTVKATEAALTALAYAIKASMSMREKMLLPGHKSLRGLDMMNAIKSPCFVSNDLLGYYVFAERKRIYRDEIEKEILTLAPEFDIKPPYKNYDDKVGLLEIESDKTITWIHLLNYQSKLQNISSMRNLNTLKNGKNRYKYSEFYTIGFTPIIKSAHLMSSRLAEINKYLNSHLDIYRSECQAPAPITDFFKIYAKKSTGLQSKPSIDIKKLRENVKVFTANLATNTSTIIINQLDKDEEKETDKDSVSQMSNKVSSAMSTSHETPGWFYLQQWPANYNYAHPAVQSIKINDLITSDSFVDIVLTLNWYKNLVVSDENSSKTADTITAICAVKDPLTSNKLKFKMVLSGRVQEIHEKLAPLATIADTALDAKNQSSDSDIYNEFLNSLKICLGLIAKLFEKKYDSQEKKFPFDLQPSNIVDLERIFNINFGSYTNNESLKNYILNLFI